MDEFKKYIQNNKGQMDIDEPSPLLWNSIEQKIESIQKTVPVITMFRWAVAACVIALAGIGSWYLLNQPKTTTLNQNNITANQPIIKKVIPSKIEAKKTVEPTMLASNSITKEVDSKANNTRKTKSNVDNTATLNSEKSILQNFESSFVQVINLQKARISTMPMYAESAEYFKDFNIQIKLMEKEEKNIKSTIEKQGINNDLLDQLINLYQQKLTVLKQLQLEMNKTNNRYKQNRGPIDTTRTYFLSI